MKVLSEYIESKTSKLDEAMAVIPNDLAPFYHDLRNCTARMKTCRNLNDVSKERDTVEKAFNAYRTISEKDPKFARSSSLWMDFVDAAWHPVWVSLEDPVSIDKKLAAFDAVRKWLVPIISKR